MTIVSLSFEEAMKELETIVRRLETGEQSLEDSITAYERGTALRQHCEKILKEAALKIEKITLTPEGKTLTEPFSDTQGG